MFEAKAIRRLAPTYAFITECGLHGRLDMGLFVDRGKLELRPGDGAKAREYRILRPRIFEMAHEMRLGDTLIATAENGQRLETWSQVSWSGHSFRLERDGLLGSTFCLLEGTRNCGELRRLSCGAEEWSLISPLISQLNFAASSLPWPSSAGGP